MNLATSTLATAASSLLQLAGLQVVARKPRSDSILHRLPPEQRAKVDRWLFDKNLTYTQVAEGCRKMFGVKISQSSVGRYFERRSQESMGGTRVSRVVSGVSPETMARSPADPSANAEAGNLEPAYRLLLQRLTETALRETHKPLDNLDAKWLCRLMRLLITARREDNFAARVRLERDMFEIGAAKACLKHWRTARGSVSRSQPRMPKDPRISCAAAMAKLLRVTDPRSVTDNSRGSRSSPLRNDMTELPAKTPPYHARPGPPPSCPVDIPRLLRQFPPPEAQPVAFAPRRLYMAEP